MKRIIGIVLCLALALPMMAQEETLCMDGTLLFREDFGGNDPSDPVAGTDPVPGMTSSYMQIYDTAHCNGRPGCTGMGSGRYLVTKVGYRNSIGYSYSHWFIMDDHTYPNDYSRGYLLEIDGRTDGATIYETIIDGLCEGSRLTFTAYAVNVTTAHSYDVDRNNGDPQLSFVLADPETGSEITTPYKTGPIPVDRSYKGMTGEWRNSAHWNLVGMNFTVPPGRTAIKLIIKNACMQYNGNDFAIDDIEIRLCAPPVTIEGEAEVCTNTSTTLTANFTNDGTFAEPLAYKWWHSTDSVTWTEIADFNGGILSFDAIQKADSGWYKVAVSGDGNIESVNCRAISEPFRLRVNECVEPLCIDGTLLFREDFGGNDPNDPAVSSLSVPGMSSQYHNSGNRLGSGNYTVRKEGWSNGIQWHRQDDHTYPNDKTRGYLLEVDGMGGAEPFYSKTIDGLCAGSKLTFSAYVVNVHYAGQLDYFGGSYVFPRMKFVLKDPTTGAVLAEKSTGDIQPDWRYGTPETWKYARDNQLSAEWQLVGMNFVVPDGIESIQMYIYNDVARNGSGNDFALDDIEIHLCAPPVTIAGETEVCENTATTLTANFTNDGTFAEPLTYKWWHSADSITWTEMSGFNGGILSFDAIQKADSGWYKVAVSGDGNIESVNCRAMSDPFLLKVNKCTEDLCVDGILLFREDFGGNDPDDPEVISDANEARAAVLGMSSGYSPCLSRTSGMSSGKFLVTKQGYQNGIQWHIMDDHTYPNDKTKGYLLQIDGRGDNAPFYTTTIEGLCPGSRLTFSAYVANVMTWGHYMNPNRDDIYPRMKFVLTDPSSGTELATYDTGDIPFDSAFIGDNSSWQYSAHWRLIGMNFTVPDNISRVKLTIFNNVPINGSGNDFVLDDIEIHLCAPPVTIEGEAEVCENTATTLTANFTNDGTFAEPLAYKWWHSADSVTWTEITDFNGGILTFNAVQKNDSGWYKVAVSGDGNIESVNCRAVSDPFLLSVNECEPPEPPTPPVPPCPEVLTVTADTTVCDTLMPFTWRGMVFEEAGEKRWMEKSPRDCDSIEHIYTLSTIHCEKPEPPTPPVPPCPEVVTERADTVVCDTLMPYRWRDTLFTESATYEILYKNERGCDSLIRVLTLGTQVCCPNVVTITADTTVCDTLMPFTWTIGGQTFVFEQAETQEREMPHPKWTECTGTNYVLRLDTFHCEKLWQIIVNKYDWQLLCNNVALREYFPGQTATAFQWYKNEQAIPGATGDDYSEHNELQGVFQLNVHLNDGRSIWSNIIEIEGPEDAPARVQIYNSQGMPVSEGQMTRGVYLYRYEKGKEVWTEKKIVL